MKILSPQPSAFSSTAPPASMPTPLLVSPPPAASPDQTRPFWALVWKQITSALKLFSREQSSFPWLWSSEIFFLYLKGKKVSQWLAKRKKKFPSFILCWGIWKGKPSSGSLWWWWQRRGRWALTPGQGQRCCSEEAGLRLLMTRGFEHLLSTCLCPGLLCPLIKHCVLWNVGYLNIEASDNATITFFYEGDTEVKEFKYLSKIRVCKLKNWEMSLGFSDSKVCSLHHRDLPMPVSSTTIWGLARALPAWVLQQYLPVLNNDTAFLH